jgi:tetratricopeptide (TPR) repeat protein
MYDWDWPGAQAEFEQAIALKPNYATALNYYSYCLAYGGQFDRAIAMSKAALEIDPLSVTANFDLGAIYLYSQHTDDAIKQLEKVIEMDPAMPVTHYFLINAYYQKGDLERFVEKLIAVRADPTLGGSPTGDWSSIGLAPERIGAVYAAGGWNGFLRAELEALLQRSKREYVAPKRIAVIYAMLGDNDKALEWLEKTYQEHSKTIVTIKVDPRLARLRSDPRFKDLLTRVGLPQ